MASTRAMIERRRFSRVGTRIPVTVFGEHSQDQCPEASAEATAISRSGALVRVPFAPTLGSRVQIRHEMSEEIREFRVVRVGAMESDGLCELGLEMLHPARNFWGVVFPGEG